LLFTIFVPGNLTINKDRKGKQVLSVDGYQWEVEGIRKR
jgi:hypothetical protein